jgi:hypothetical protein
LSNELCSLDKNVNQPSMNKSVTSAGYNHIKKTMSIHIRKFTDTRECSDFTLDCFVFEDQSDITPEGPYTCKTGGIANFPVQESICN